MNTNIYLFSHIEKNKKDEKINIKVLPSSNKLAKLIKVLMINFPEYTKNDFINYLTDFMKEDNCTFNSLIDKKKEVSTLLTSANKRSLKLSHKNKASTNSVIKNIIQKIPTYTISSHNTPVEFNNLSESNINNLSEINKIKYSNDIKSFDFFNKVNDCDRDEDGKTTALGFRWLSCRIVALRGQRLRDGLAGLDKGAVIADDCTVIKHRLDFRHRLSGRSVGLKNWVLANVDHLRRALPGIAVRNRERVDTLVCELLAIPRRLVESRVRDQLRAVVGKHLLLHVNVKIT